MFNNSKSETNKNNKDSPLWMILMDQSQLVMTVVGLIGNIATSITLIKNGQVRGILDPIMDGPLGGVLRQIKNGKVDEVHSRR